MRVEARVASVDDDGSFMIEVSHGSLCEGCSGACMWRRRGAFFHGPFRTDYVPTVGKPIVISLPAGTVLGVSALVHGLPWAGLVAGAVTGAWLFGSDAAAVVGAAVTFGSGLLTVSRMRSRLEHAVTRHMLVIEKP